MTVDLVKVVVDVSSSGQDVVTIVFSVFVPGA